MTSTVPADSDQRAALLDEWVATRREIARLEAAASDLLAQRMRLFEADVRAHQDGRDVIRRSMVAEYAAAGHLAKGTVELALSDASALDEDLPAVREALREGLITPSHVREITRAGAIVREAVLNGTIEADALTAFAVAAVAIAETDTSARTRPQVRAVAATLAQVTLLERHAKAAEERSVSVQLLDDGLARLVAVLPEYLAVAIYDRLTRMTTRIARESRSARVGADAGAETDADDADRPGASESQHETKAVDVDAPESRTEADDGRVRAPASPAEADAARVRAPASPTEADAGRTTASGSRTEANCGIDSAPQGASAYRTSASSTVEWTDEDDLAAWFDLALSVHHGMIDPDQACPPVIPDWMVLDDSLDDEPGEFLCRTGPPPPRPLEPLPRVGDRTYDQIRADLLTDLLLAADPSSVQGTGLDAITGHLQVTVAATTLAGADEQLAELDGHGPLHPDIARDLASRNSGWTRLFLDPAGMVTETDTYTPTTGMRRFLRARDEHCRFPGCRVPAARCDIDHNHEHAAGGSTALDNLTHLCRAHHALKHPDLHDQDRWTARVLPDGRVSWTSPLGRNYADPPVRRVMFA